MDTPLDVHASINTALHLHEQGMDLQRRAKDVFYRVNQQLADIKKQLKDNPGKSPLTPEMFLLLMYGVAILEDPCIKEEFEKLHQKIQDHKGQEMLVVNTTIQSPLHTLLPYTGKMLEYVSYDLILIELTTNNTGFIFNMAESTCLIPTQKSVYSYHNGVPHVTNTNVPVDVNRLISKWYRKNIERTNEYYFLFGEKEIRQHRSEVNLSDRLQAMREALK